MMCSRSSVHDVLSRIETTAQSGDLRQVAEALDAAKPQLFESFQERLQHSLAAKAVTLKLLNLFLAKHHFLSRSAEVLSKPSGLVVDPSNACNLACPGCVHSTHAKELKLFDWKPGIATESRMAAFFRHYGPAAIHVILCNYGEPLVHPDTPKFIRMAKAYLIHTMISTNLSLARFDAEAYVESGLDHMLLSIDGVSQPVYERFRQKGEIDLVYRNVAKLVAARRRAGKRTPTIAWRFLAFEHNVHEIPAAIERARELGVDQFSADPAWDISWDDPAIRTANIEPVRVDFREDTYDALVENWNPYPESLDADAIERDFAQSWAARVRERNGRGAAAAGGSCEWLYKSITMDSGGRILPCCCSPTPSRDLHFAQFDENDPERAFNSEKHRMSRMFFADSARYRAEREAGTLQKDPHCVDCEWDKTADPSSAQIRNYFQVAAGDLIDGGSLDRLANW